jgi:KTSC domain
MGYDADSLELEIEYRKSGDVYLYFDVPAEEYRDFMAADSKGTYLNQVFKLRGYRYVVVNKAKS